MSEVKTNPAYDTIDRWFDNADPGDWVGVFENHDLGHRDLGQRVAFLFPVEQWGVVELGRTTAPDGSFGLGWRYLLVETCTTRESAKAALTTLDCDYCGKDVWDHRTEPRFGETEWFVDVHKDLP